MSGVSIHEGSRDLPRAMAALPHLHGILIGAGTEALSLPDNVQALGLRHDVRRFYMAADIVVSRHRHLPGILQHRCRRHERWTIPIVHRHRGRATHRRRESKGRCFTQSGIDCSSPQAVSECRWPSVNRRPSKREKNCGAILLSRNIDRYARLTTRRKALSPPVAKIAQPAPVAPSAGLKREAGIWAMRSVH